MSSTHYGYTHKDFQTVDIDAVDPEDYKAVLAARESVIRDSWIKAMEARLVQEELSKVRRGEKESREVMILSWNTLMEIQCYKTEGTNHYVQCHALVERYLGMLKDNRVRQLVF